MGKVLHKMNVVACKMQHCCAVRCLYPYTVFQMPSLRGKILTTYGFSKGVLLVFAAVVFADLYYLRTQIEAGEAVGAFREAAQEMRREEKNLFLYREIESLDHLLAQVDAAEIVLKAGQQTFAKIASGDDLRRLQTLLPQYRTQMEAYPLLSAQARAAAQQTIRASGQALSALAETFSRRERTVLADAVRTSSHTLLGVFVAVLLLGVAGALFLVRQVVRPLRTMEMQLNTLAEGRLRQLTPPSQDQEFQSFVQAINAMLERLRVQQSQLRHHEKAAALGVLVSGVAHELNNPLSNISTSAQLLLEDCAECASDDGKMKRQWLAQIDGETERARRIVRRLLDSVRQPKLHLQPHAVGELIQASLALVNRQLPAGVQVCVGATPDCAVQADRERLHQLFINLIKNAADAGATQIDISAAQTHWADSQAGRSEHLVGETDALASAASILQIQIADNGPGIAPENLARIFDPFFTTHSAGDGTGLGLYLVEEIVSEHHGCIAVENRAGGGACFVVWLPLTQTETI